MNKRKDIPPKKRENIWNQKNIIEYPQEANDQPNDNSIAPEAIDREEPEQPIHIPMINNAIGIESIKGYLTNCLKAEHLEKLIEKVR